MAKFYLFKHNDRELRNKILLRRSTTENLLKFLLEREYNIVNSEFRRNNYGEPFLYKQNIKFSISYSENFIICVIGENDIGVDIEKITSIKISSFSNVLSFNEFQHIKRNQEKEQYTEFYRVWTAKESYIKAIRRGLYKSLSSFELDFMSNLKML
ncbi:MAG TPA: 4'-phosphopantetheinyl transferase superfamily protein [Bacillales bacterium]|nr:4'-phosphopantetheinyl transferase superfamily protein [Bacillales bacterium]